MKYYKFFFHYNKPRSKIAGKPILSVHFRGKCYFAEKVICYPSCQSKNNKTQPYCVIEGEAENIYLEKNNTILIN